MKIGLIGLGRMGGNIARRLMRDGHQTVVYDNNPDARAALAKDGGEAVESLEALVKALPSPRVVWVMLPAGEITETTIAKISDLMGKDDIVIDGGNTFYKDDARRAEDPGRQGPALCRRRHLRRRVGPRPWLLHDDRRRQADRRLPRPHLQDPCPGRRRHPAHRRPRRPRPARREWLHACRPGRCGPLRQDDPQRHRVRHDAIVRGRLRYPEEPQRRLPARARALLSSTWQTSPKSGAAAAWCPPGCSTSPPAPWPRVPSWTTTPATSDDSGEGRWTINAAIEEAVPAEVLTSALFARFRSRQDHTYAERLLSAMRMGFGGHIEGRGKPPKEGDHS